MTGRPAVIRKSDPIAEAWREEGRKDVLREIAAIKDPESGYEGFCLFCEASIKIPIEDGVYERHKPSCLWFRAQSAAPVR